MFFLFFMYFTLLLIIFLFLYWFNVDFLHGICFILFFYSFVHVFLILDVDLSCLLLCNVFLFMFFILVCVFYLRGFHGINFFLDFCVFVMFFLNSSVFVVFYIIFSDLLGIGFIFVFLNMFVFVMCFNFFLKTHYRYLFCFFSLFVMLCFFIFYFDIKNFNSLVWFFIMFICSIVFESLILNKKNAEVVYSVLDNFFTCVFFAPVCYYLFCW